jgi:hypothetical protein
MVPPPKVTNNRKIEIDSARTWEYGPRSSRWGDYAIDLETGKTIQDYITPSWTEVTPVAYSKWDGDVKTDSPLGWPEWISEYMQVQHTTHDIGKREIVGLLLVDPTKPDSDKAAVVYLTSKFLALVDRTREEGMKLTRLPEIVIGQVGNGYQAQVTLTVHWQPGY